MGEWPSQPVTDFHGRPLAEPGTPVGYAAVIERYGLRLPLPARLTAIAERHHPQATAEWQMLTPRHMPDATLTGHLTLAFRYEGIDLSVLAQLFQAEEPDAFAQIVRDAPTGSFARRIWFLYEWMTGSRLDVPDAGKVRLVLVVDTDLQLALAESAASPRHRVANNLPGTPQYCPMVRRTDAILAYEAQAFDERARAVVGRIRADLVARAAAFLLLNDSKSSFAIEGEKPSGTRAARWGQAIAEAGSRPLSLGEFDRLQSIVIGDQRFVRLGLREEGGFVGVHDRETGVPVPDHVSARESDLHDLVEGLVAYSTRAVAGGMDPVAAAAVLAFGFVYIHPYVDGNGRLHRWLFHHVLASAGFNPPGMVFPISAVILRRIEAYKSTLTSYSGPLLPFIEWEPTPKGNLRVLNDTADFYRFFDATAHVEFLYGCVQQTIEEDLPREARFLEAFDNFNEAVQQIVDMPTAQVELLLKFLEQNQGRLSQRARSREFEALTPVEVEQVEAIYADAFGPEEVGDHLRLREEEQ